MADGRDARTVRILCLEDDPNDAELIVHHLSALPLNPLIDHVETGEAFRSHLSANRYDLILCDYSIPGFSGTEALSLAVSQAPDVPFIFFSGTIGEEAAIDSLLQGATDYVVKQRPARLRSAVTRALELAELRRRQRSAQDSLRFQADILNSVTEGVIATDVEGAVVYWNHGAQSILARSAKDVMMQPIQRACSDVEPGCFASLMSDVERDGVGRRTVEYRRIGEPEPKWISIAARPLTDSRDAKLGYLIIVTDVTDQHVSREQVLRLNAELEERVRLRTAALAEANEELNKFAYSVSHDLKAPLRAMGGYAAVLREDFAERLGEEGLRVVSRIGAAATRMDLICQGLLRLSRLSSAQLVLEEVDLSQVAATIAAELMEANPGQDIEWTIDQHLLATADPSLVRSLLENLLGNAVKFSGQSRPSRVEVGRTRTERGMAFFVRDNGIGFSAEHANQIFEPFQRLHREDEYPGVGIGLSTAVRIAKRHNGEMWAESEPDKGATFYFTMGSVG